MYGSSGNDYRIVMLKRYGYKEKVLKVLKGFGQDLEKS